MFPHYSYPFEVVAGLLRDALLGRRRSFRRDAALALARLEPPLRILAPGNIPQAGRWVITVNHYYRPGFAAQWLALAISATIPMDIHWIMTGELTYPGAWYAPLGRALSRLALGRGARVYGFTTMPPMPPRPEDVQVRAAAVRKVLEYVRRSAQPVVGLAPEGGDQGRGKLCLPAPGLGRFALLLAAEGLHFLPVGVYESGTELCLDFGQAYELALPSHLGPARRDLEAARRIMVRLAAQLPASLRGEFG